MLRARGADEKAVFDFVTHFKAQHQLDVAALEQSFGQTSISTRSSSNNNNNNDYDVDPNNNHVSRRTNTNSNVNNNNNDYDDDDFQHKSLLELRGKQQILVGVSFRFVAMLSAHSLVQSEMRIRMEVH